MGRKKRQDKEGKEVGGLITHYVIFSFLLNTIIGRKKGVNLTAWVYVLDISVCDT